jgi:hypothetical protein
MISCAHLHSAFGPGCPHCWQPLAVEPTGHQARTSTRPGATAGQAAGPDEPSGIVSRAISALAGDSGQEPGSASVTAPLGDSAAAA